MIITLHAAKRFLERVIGKAEFTSKDLELANAYLTKVFQNVVPTSVAKRFALPGFIILYNILLIKSIKTASKDKIIENEEIILPKKSQEILDKKDILTTTDLI